MTTKQNNIVETFEDLIKEDTSVDYVNVPLGNGKVQRIGSLSAAEMLEWQELRSTPAGRKVSGAVLILKSIVNDAGLRVGVVTPYADMSDEEKGKVATTSKLKHKTSEVLLKAILQLNGLTVAQELVAKND